MQAPRVPSRAATGVRALALIPVATQYRTNAVFISHLVALVLLPPVVIGIGWRLNR